MMLSIVHFLAANYFVTLLKTLHKFFLYHFSIYYRYPLQFDTKNDFKGKYKYFNFLLRLFERNLKTLQHIYLCLYLLGVTA